LKLAQDQQNGDSCKQHNQIVAELCKGMHAVQLADGTFYAWKISLAAAKHSGQKIIHSHSVFKWLGFNGTFNTNINWQKTHTDGIFKENSPQGHSQICI